MVKKLIKYLSQFVTVENVKYELFAADGTKKKVFQTRWLMSYITKHFGIQFPQNFLFGSWQDSLVLRNLVTSAGKAAMASRCNGSGAEAAFTYVAIGIGTGAAVIGDTALGSEIALGGGGTRVLATLDRFQTTVANDTARLIANWTFSAGYEITESGVFNAGPPAPAGTILARQVFSVLNVAPADSLQVTWTFQFS